MDTTNQQARLVNNSGLQLIIPKEGNGSLLFMEWMASFPGGRPPMITIINDTEDHAFKIRMVAIKQTFLDAKEYINANL